MAKLLEFFNKYKKDVIIPSVVLLVICIVIPLSLSLTNSVTKEKIAELQIENQNQNMSRLINAKEFKEKTFKSDSNEFTYFVAKNGDSVKGYIFITEADGYGGKISVMTAVNNDGTIKSVSILDASGETPGLGQNVTKKDFYSQYSGKSGEVFMLKSGAQKGEKYVNAVTGATISSTAVNKAVNNALSNFAQLEIKETEVPNSEKQ